MVGVVESCRSVDKCLQTNKKVNWENIQAILNFSLVLVQPNKILNVLVERKEFYSAMMLIQRSDVIDRVLVDANGKDLN
jgi:hypothetical protein